MTDPTPAQRIARAKELITERPDQAQLEALIAIAEMLHGAFEAMAKLPAPPPQRTAGYRAGGPNG